jgi:predicted phage-related endonuclease
MITKNLKFFRIPTGTESWHNFRTIGLNKAEADNFSCEPYEGGIGASEMGTILGLNKWRPVIQEYYHFKVGTEKPNQIENAAMMMGKILEPVIKDIWSCYDGENWIENYSKWVNAESGDRKKFLVRDARKVNAYIVNSSWPYLFVSLDYFAEKNTARILDGGIEKEGFPNEIKSLNGHYAEKWLSGVPEYHIAQINQQMLVTNSNYCELSILIDGREFKLYPFTRDDELCERIIKYGDLFWKRVLKGREHAKVMNEYLMKGDLENLEKERSYIDSLEPEPDNSEAYQKYIRERYTKFVQSFKGGLKEVNYAKEYEAVLRFEECIKDKKNGIKNHFLHVLDSNNAEEIDLDALGKITFYENKKEGRTLRINTILKPDKKKIDLEFSKLNFKL